MTGATSAPTRRCRCTNDAKAGEGCTEGVSTTPAVEEEGVRHQGAGTAPAGRWRMPVPRARAVGARARLSKSMPAATA
jgi:hypothetical protein